MADVPRQRKRTGMREEADGLHIPLRKRDDLVIDEPCAVGDIAEMMKIVRVADEKVPPLADPIDPSLTEAPDGEGAASRTKRERSLAEAVAQQQAQTQVRQAALVDAKPYVEAFLGLLRIVAPDDEITEADLYPWVISGSWSARFFNFMLVPFDGDETPDDATLLADAGVASPT